MKLKIFKIWVVNYLEARCRCLFLNLRKIE